VSERQARTASGRLVRFRYDENDRQQISMTQRNGKNTPIQGTSADILKRALKLLKDELSDTSARVVNIIHDEVVVEADADEAEGIAKKVERAMVAAAQEYVKPYLLRWKQRSRMSGLNNPEKSCQSCLSLPRQTK